jgi:hypothetical protein
MITAGHSGRVKDLCQFFRLPAQGGQTLGEKQPGEFRQFNPEPCFIRFLQHDCDLVDEIRPGFGAQDCAIIGCNRSAASRHLIGDGSTRRLVGERIRELQNADSKLHRSLFKFGRVQRRFSVAIAV